MSARLPRPGNPRQIAVPGRDRSPPVAASPRLLPGLTGYAMALCASRLLGFVVHLVLWHRLLGLRVQVPDAWRLRRGELAEVIASACRWRSWLGRVPHARAGPPIGDSRHAPDLAIQAGASRAGQPGRPSTSSLCCPRSGAGVRRRPGVSASLGTMPGTFRGRPWASVVCRIM